jgi:hypothetical protein
VDARVPFWDLKSAKPAESDSKIFEALTPDDDRLNAAVSHAGIGPTVGVGCTSAVERTTDLSQTSRYVREVPTGDIEVTERKASAQRR